MTNINRVGGEGYKPTPGDKVPKDAEPIEKESRLEIFRQIFKNSKSAGSAETSSYDKVTIKAAITQENKSIKEFVECLNEILEKNTDQIKSVTLSSTIPFSVNLLEINSSASIVKESILNQLKDLKNEDLDKLENRTTSKNISLPFENIFALAKLYREIEVVKSITKNDFIYQRLGQIVNELLKYDEIGKAIDVAYDIYHINIQPMNDSIAAILEKPNINYMKLHVFFRKQNIRDQLIENLLEDGKIGMVIIAANIIGEIFLKNKTKTAITNKLRKIDAEKLIEIAKTTRLGYLEADVFEIIASKYLQQGAIDKAIKYAKRIPQKYRTTISLLILRKLLELRNFCCLIKFTVFY